MKPSLRALVHNPYFEHLSEELQKKLVDAFDHLENDLDKIPGVYTGTPQELAQNLDGIMRCLSHGEKISTDLCCISVRDYFPSCKLRIEELKSVLTQVSDELGDRERQFAKKVLVFVSALLGATTLAVYYASGGKEKNALCPLCPEPDSLGPIATLAKLENSTKETTVNVNKPPPPPPPPPPSFRNHPESTNNAAVSSFVNTSTPTENSRPLTVYGPNPEEFITVQAAALRRLQAEIDRGQKLIDENLNQVTTLDRQLKDTHILLDRLRQSGSSDALIYEKKIKDLQDMHDDKLKELSLLHTSHENLQSQVKHLKETESQKHDQISILEKQLQDARDIEHAKNMQVTALERQLQDKVNRLQQLEIAQSGSVDKRTHDKKVKDLQDLYQKTQEKYEAAVKEDNDVRKQITILQKKLKDQEKKVNKFENEEAQIGNSILRKYKALNEGNEQEIAARKNYIDKNKLSESLADAATKSNVDYWSFWNVFGNQVPKEKTRAQHRQDTDKALRAEAEATQAFRNWKESVESLKKKVAEYNNELSRASSSQLERLKYHKITFTPQSIPPPKNRAKELTDLLNTRVSGESVVVVPNSLEDLASILASNPNIDGAGFAELGNNFLQLLIQLNQETHNFNDNAASEIDDIAMNVHRAEDKMRRIKFADAADYVEQGKNALKDFQLKIEQLKEKQQSAKTIFKAIQSGLSKSRLDPNPGLADSMKKLEREEQRLVDWNSVAEQDIANLNNLGSKIQQVGGTLKRKDVVTDPNQIENLLAPEGIPAQHAEAIQDFRMKINAANDKLKSAIHAILPNQNIPNNEILKQARDIIHTKSSVYHTKDKVFKEQLKALKSAYEDAWQLHERYFRLRPDLPRDIKAQGLRHISDQYKGRYVFLNNPEQARSFLARNLCKTSRTSSSLCKYRGMSTLLPRIKSKLRVVSLDGNEISKAAAALLPALAGREQKELGNVIARYNVKRAKKDLAASLGLTADSTSTNKLITSALEELKLHPGAPQSTMPDQIQALLLALNSDKKDTSVSHAEIIQWARDLDLLSSEAGTPSPFAGLVALLDATQSESTWNQFLKETPNVLRGLATLLGTGFVLPHIGASTGLPLSEFITYVINDPTTAAMVFPFLLRRKTG